MIRSYTALAACALVVLPLSGCFSMKEEASASYTRKLAQKPTQPTSPVPAINTPPTHTPPPATPPPVSPPLVPPPPTPPPTTTPPVTPPPSVSALSSINLYISGHSLTDYLEQYIEPISEGLGYSFTSREASILGSPISYRWSKRSYMFNFEDNDTGNDTPDLGTTPYDTMIITENHQLIRNLPDTMQYMRRYHERFIQGNSRGQTYYYHSWLSINVNDTGPWLRYEKAAAPLHQCIADRINFSLQREGRSDRIHNIPANLALVALVEAKIAGASALSNYTLRDLFQYINNESATVPVHPSPVTWYYLSLVSYGLTYHRSPLNAPAPPAYLVNLSSATLSYLRTLADTQWQLFEAAQASRPTPTAATLATCASQASALVDPHLALMVSASDDYRDDDSRNAAGRRSSYANTTTGPFRTSDSGFW